MSVKSPLLLPVLKNLLKDPERHLNLLVMQNSSRTYLQKKYQIGFPASSKTIGEHLQSSIMIQPGRTGVVGVLNRRYLPSDLI